MLFARSYAVPRPPDEPWLAAATDVSLTAPGGETLRGWRVPSRQGAAVLLVHGGLADRRQLLPDARALAAAGYGLLMLDLPGNGESTGPKRRGVDEPFLEMAIDALATSGDVRPDRIGAYGFSGGATFLADVVARDTRVRAVVLAGCYPDTTEHVMHDYRRWGLLSEIPALLVVRWAGVTLVRPEANVATIAPRPVFFITGDADEVVPAASVERLYAAASEPKELWVVPGAAHGDYAKVSGDYEHRLVAFFDRTLGPQRGPP